MGDDPRPIPSGTEGTVLHVDDIGTVHCKFDNGRSLGLILGEDEFHSIEKESRMMNEMRFKLEPVQVCEEEKLFFSDNKYDAEHGCIGHLRIDFDSSGQSFFTTWFPHACGDKNTPTFSQRFDAFINQLRETVLKSRADMRSYCRDNDGAQIPFRPADDCWGFRAFDGNFAYYLRCNPQEGDYDGYCYVYDRNMLMEHLAGQVGLPSHCYSNLPSDGTPIMIRYAEKGYYPLLDMPDDVTVEKLNDMLGVTPAQKQAMEAGSMFGWNVPGADPVTYETKNKETKHMEIAIYQINSDKDYGNVSYQSMDALKQIHGTDHIDAGIYDKVFEGDAEAASLEDVFQAFNLNIPADCRGHSLSVSDVVEVKEADGVEPGFYFCDSVGFEKVDFDVMECGTKVPMRVLIVEPGKPAYEKVIEPGLAALQQEVGGTIETFYPFDDDTMIICNDEGKITGLPLNRSFRDDDNQIYDIIAGTFVICGSGYSDCIGLTDAQVSKYMDMYKTPECFVSINGNIHVYPVQVKTQDTPGEPKPAAKGDR